MNNLPDVLQLLVGAIVMIGVALVLNGPQFLAEWAHDKQRQAERAATQQAEIERKLAIAEAAIAARGRGETFVPPADYAR
jgi:Tfp pilus assembly protein PilN